MLTLNQMCSDDEAKFVDVDISMLGHGPGSVNL